MLCYSCVCTEHIIFLRKLFLSIPKEIPHRCGKNTENSKVLLKNSKFSAQVSIIFFSSFVPLGTLVEWWILQLFSFSPSKFVLHHVIKHFALHWETFQPSSTLLVQPAIFCFTFSTFCLSQKCFVCFKLAQMHKKTCWIILALALMQFRVCLSEVAQRKVCYVRKLWELGWKNAKLGNRRETRKGAQRRRINKRIFVNQNKDGKSAQVM